MLTKPRPIHGQCAVDVTDVTLIPAPGWDKTPKHPGVQYYIKGYIPYMDPDEGELIGQVSFFIDTEFDETSGKPIDLGIEAEMQGMTPTIPPFKGSALEPLMEKLPEGGMQVVTDDNDAPVFRDPFTEAHPMCCAHLVDTAGGAQILLNDFALEPAFYPESAGILAGQPIFTKNKPMRQVFHARYLKGYEPVKSRRASAANREGAAAATSTVNKNGRGGAKVPQWYLDRQAAEQE
jgi:hypothetical protein